MPQGDISAFRHGGMFCLSLPIVPDTLGTGLVRRYGIEADPRQALAMAQQELPRLIQGPGLYFTPRPHWGFRCTGYIGMVRKCSMEGPWDF